MATIEKVEVNDNNYHDTTFEPVEVTPAVESQEIPSTPETNVDEKVDSQVETPDNDTVRYQYWQSEAMRKENALRIREQELETLRQQMTQAQAPKDEIPQRPNNDDPNEWLQYNAKMNEYNAKLINELRSERQEEVKQRQQYEREMSARNQVINKLTDVTKNPQKAQKILGFFADTKNLQDPALYNVMYDAAQAYLNKSSVVKPNLSPLPPIDGGEAIVAKVTPDDEFNKSLGQRKTYRL